jgi:quercetin dioxygenase-like cupin family protein
MIRQGQTLSNPVTGEQLTFLETSAETLGEYVLVELRAAPGSPVAPRHVHPGQTETFEVISGWLGAKVDGRTIEAAQGSTLVLEPGQSHVWWNAGDTELVVRREIRPALQFESLVETMFALAADGKTNGRGMPSPLRLAAIGAAHFDTVRLPVIPAWLQKAALRAGASVGVALGYEATYPPLSRLSPRLVTHTV